MCELSTIANYSCKNAQMRDWDDLRFFLAVAREGSISAAAALLGVNHSTVSRRINGYEKLHGVRLFERLHSGYAMTQAAENIYQHALRIEQHTLSVERDLFGVDQRLQGKLCVTVYHATARHFLLPNLTEFSRRYPNIDVELSITTAVRDLAAREADIAIRGTPKPPDYLVGKKVAEFQHGLYTSSAYQNREQKGYDVVLWRDDPALPEWVALHCPGARVALRVDDVATMIGAVQQGIGMARLPCWLADLQPDLSRLNVRIEQSGWGLWVLIHADLRSTARVRVCRDFLIDLLEGHKDLFEGRQSRYL